MSFQAPYALITGGGTMAQVDAMRSMANKAKGGFAVTFAHHFARRGIPVVLVLSEFAFYKHRSNLPKGAKVIVFSTFKEYLEAIDEAVQTYGQPGYAMSAAAVSDFGFLNPIEGKISSSSDELVLRIPKLPKVLDTWREKFGIECLIVGFKLLSQKNSSLQDVIAAARKQNKRARLNGTIANLAEEIGGGQHPIWWVTPDGGVVRIEGHSDDVARQIVEIMARYRATHWHRSVQVVDGSPEIVFAEASPIRAQLVRDLIEFAQDAGLLCDTSGNVAVAPGDGSLLVNPRATDKSKLELDDLISVRLGNPDKREVLFSGSKGQKPSIDSSVHLHVHRAFAHAASLHFHDGWVVGENMAKTRLSYPCGTLEQAMSVLEALACNSNVSDAWLDSDTLMLEMTNHGHVLYLRDLNAVNQIRKEWDVAASEYLFHLKQIGRPDFARRVSLSLIFAGDVIAGVVARTEEGWHSFYLNGEARGMGLGQQLVDQINQRGVLVAAHDNCEVAEFYQARGFRTVQRIENEGVWILEPPSIHKNLRRAATLTLHNPITDRVLLVERGEDTSYPGYFAHVGGIIDPEDHDALCAGIREAGEEIGVDLTGLPEPAPENVSVHYTGWVKPGGEERAYVVTNILVRVLIEYEADVDLVEIASASWYDKETARGLKMGHATREALRKVWPGF